MVKRDKKFVQLVGDIIAKQRIKNGLLQTELAAMLGISKGQLNNIEDGNNGITPETMLKLSVIFSCPIADLFPSLDQYKPKIKIPLTGKKKVRDQKSSWQQKYNEYLHEINKDGGGDQTTGLTKNKTDWSNADLKFLYENLARLTFTDISIQLGKSNWQVMYRTNIEARNNPSAFIIPENIPFRLQKKVIFFITQTLKEKA